MAASITTHALLNLIHRQPGIDLGALERETQVHRRTLQRRLAELVARGEVSSQRLQRSVIFMPAARHSVGEPQSTYGVATSGADEFYITVSPAGQAIKDAVRRPKHERKPVGYRVAFLEAYRPNVTFYLPQGVRDQLLQIGQSPDTQAPAGTFARAILDRLLIDLSWASSRLEGNTYDLLDTERLFEFGQAAEGKDEKETRMVLNHKAAIEYLVQNADDMATDTQTFIALHALLSEGLMGNNMASGALRKRVVEIGGSVYMPLGVPQSIEPLFNLVASMAADIIDPFEQAFFLMVHLPYLQPFEDVNKRVSRLAANIPLIKANLSPLSFVDLPERAYIDAMLGVYELNRVELLVDVFVWAYERSCVRYVSVKEKVVVLDQFRVRHRAALTEAARAIVRGGLGANKTNIRKLMPASVPRDAQAKFVDTLLDIFSTMHAGNAVQYGVRALEYDGWKGKRG